MWNAQNQLLRVWIALGVCLLQSLPVRADDAYLTYIETAPEFKSIPQRREMLTDQWNTWLYMPWRYRWTIGTNAAGGKFSRDYGIHGGFVDSGSGPFEWLNQWDLKFYHDHAAGKGLLYLRGANSKSNFAQFQRDGLAIRSGIDGPQPLTIKWQRELEDRIRRNITNVNKNSQLCVAHALDDEISWGAFVTPLAWRINEDDEAYQQWLTFYYGGENVPQAQFVTPDFTYPQLSGQLNELNFAPLLDRITYNDSVWSNSIGNLVKTCNKYDPDTPAGFVGGQSPNIWGGYDYAKLMKKVQFIESYNLGSSMEIIRSFNPDNMIPVVTTHFHKPELTSANDIWQAWYYLAHGNRGMIGWVDGWFDGETPKSWLDDVKPTFNELTTIQGKKVVGAKWIHDGVAIYYSHPSIQVSWLLDAEAHRKTWVNRGSDHRLGTSHNVRKAWENLLTDSGLQYNFVSYDEVITEGVPDEYKVLILPACYAMSDIEAQRISEFAVRGGTVIADFACGLFDQHGNGRSSGVLDDLFGVKHDGTERAADFFGDRLWVETDQDAGFSYKTHREFFGTIKTPIEDGYAKAERKLPTHTVRTVGQGKAVYVNLSPQRYLQDREEETATDATRMPFLQHVSGAGVEPWVTVLDENRKRPANLELTYWNKNGRTLLFVIQNVSVGGDSLGGGGAQGLKKEKTTLNIEFTEPVRNAINERTDKKLGNGKSFSVQLNSAEAVMISFDSE